MTETLNSKNTAAENLTVKNLPILIALIPLCVFSAAVSSSPLHSILVFAVSVAWCFIFETLGQKLLKQKLLAHDLTAVICGLELALLLPEQIQLWQVILGALVAIVAAKLFFGGNGSYVFSPALIGRAFLFVSFKSAFSESKWLFPCGDEKQAVWAMALIAAAFLYLVVMKAISPESAASAASYAAVLLAACILYSLISGEEILPSAAGFMASGAVLFMADFIITDPTILPDSALGKILYGAFTAILTFIIMIPGKTQDGAMFAILIMNAVAPYFNQKKKAKVPAANAGGAK